MNLYVKIFLLLFHCELVSTFHPPVRINQPGKKAHCEEKNHPLVMLGVYSVEEFGMGACSRLTRGSFHQFGRVPPKSSLGVCWKAEPAVCGKK